jgi:3-dehydroquinate synthetase
MDMLETSDADRIRSLLIAYGLPTRADVEASTVRLKMTQDKKKSGGKQRWILPVSSGGVQIVEGVPEDIVDRAIASVTASQ